MTEEEKYFTYTDIQTGDSPIKRLVIKDRESGISSLQKQLRTLEQENEVLLKQKNGIMATNIKYFMALEEIREKTEKFDYFNSTLTDASNIIQRIREVIDEIN